jgi:hypothetical protein
VQPAGDARGTVGDLGMIAPALAANDAEEGLGRFAHGCFFVDDA